MNQSEKNIKMNKKIAVGLAVVISLFVGIGIGAAGGDDGAKAEKTSQIANKTPTACLKALDVSEETLSGPIKDNFGLAADLTQLIPLAYDAGTSYNEQDAMEVINKMKKLTRQIEANNAILSELDIKYDEQAKKCRDNK